MRTHNNIPLGGSPRYLFIAGGIGIMAILANVSVLAGTGGTDRIGVVTNLRVSLKVADCRQDGVGKPRILGVVGRSRSPLLVSDGDRKSVV